MSPKITTRFASLQVAVLAAAVLATGCAASGAARQGAAGQEQNAKPPKIGLHDYTQSHAKNRTSPDRLGGPVVVTAEQTRGSTRWVLPGPRSMDPAVFGTPAHPVGWDQAPFPLVGVPPKMRRTLNGRYSIVDHATPFSDWMEVGVGDLQMKAVDITAIDGRSTRDKVRFEARFAAPDDSHDYRVVAHTPLPHGKAYPSFGGVVTDHLMHGSTGIGTKLMPTEYAYVSFWAKGDVYVDGRLTNEDQLVHVMITEFVRGDGNELQFDGGVGEGGTGKVLHLMVPPYRIGPKGPEAAPLRSGYIPFPEVKKRLMAEQQKISQLPPAEREQAADELKAVKELMAHTKEHVQEAMAAGKMFGQPFFHVMFGNVEIDVERPDHL